jgi:hypothetical protein
MAQNELMPTSRAADPDPARSSGFFHSALGGLAALYAAAAKLAIGRLEDLSDARAQRRDEHRRRKQARPSKLKAARASRRKIS